MLRRSVNVLLLTLASAANAEGCPDFFRFVDFGLQDADSRFVRGGLHFRGESFAGEALLKREETVCREVRDLARDGRGNPIPVVSHIAYDVAKTDLDLRLLHVSHSVDIRGVAEANAQVHRARLTRGEIEQFRGQNSLCVVDQLEGELSCQLVSPYPGDIDLVVHCDRDQCSMPVLAINETIKISAIWPVAANFWTKLDRAGPQILATVQSIHDFLEPLSSDL